MKRDLRTGRPVWLGYEHAQVASSPLRTDLTTDVVVVGAGVSGALVADALLRSGKRVVVLDRRGPIMGSTPASTAMLLFELDTPLTHLVERIGRDAAARAYWRSATAVTSLRGRLSDLGLRCGFRERRSVYLPGNVLDVSALREEARTREALGLRSRFLEAPRLRTLTGIERAGAILSTGSAEVDPVAMVTGLWNSAQARGARIFSPSEVVDVAATRSRVTLTTAEGHEVRAKHAVFATGYEIPKTLSYPDHSIHSTWAMATRPQPERLRRGRCLVWEAADPYLYLRTTLDGRVVVGGEDEPFADERRRDALIPRKVAALRRKLHQLLPEIDTTPDFSWAGCFGQTSSGLPAFGALPGMPRCFAVLGYGGNGITFSVIAAELIHRAILGIGDPDTDLFALHS